VFQRIIDDVKASTGSAVRLSSLAAIAAVALFIALSFLCAAAFVVVMDVYGLVQACLAVQRQYELYSQRARLASAAHSPESAWRPLVEPLERACATPGPESR